jgi:hypothetical protein
VTKKKPAKKPAGKKPKKARSKIEKRPGGRPSTFTQPVADAICARIAIGEPVRHICLTEGMPEERTFYRWLLKSEEFRQQYAHAKEAQAERFAEELIEIADDATNDWMERLDKDARPVGWMLNADHVQRSRLRVDARKWLMGKMKPKKYGDSTTLKGDEDAPNPVKHSGGVTLTPTETYMAMLKVK